MMTGKVWGVIVGLVALVMFLNAAAFEMSLCSYRSPETFLTNAGVSPAYQFFDDANTVGVDVSAGQIDFSFARLHDTESYAFVARLDGRVGLRVFCQMHGLERERHRFGTTYPRTLRCLASAGSARSQRRAKPDSGWRSSRSSVSGGSMTSSRWQGRC